MEGQTNGQKDRKNHDVLGYETACELKITYSCKKNEQMIASYKKDFRILGAFSKFANASKMESKLKGISRENNAIQENLNPNREKKGKCEIKRRILGK